MLCAMPRHHCQITQRLYGETQLPYVVVSKYYAWLFVTFLTIPFSKLSFASWNVPPIALQIVVIFSPLLVLITRQLCDWLQSLRQPR